MKSIVVVLSVCAAFGVSQATRVRPCGTQDSPVENSEINMPTCEKLPCKLKKGTTAVVEFKFTAKADTAKVLNSVHAMILGVPFPFIGVDGNSICDKVFDPSGVKAKCPLKAGQQYLYKDGFKVLDIYPKLKTWVHWALVDDSGNTIQCLEVPVKITS